MIAIMPINIIVIISLTLMITVQKWPRGHFLGEKWPTGDFLFWLDFHNRPISLQNLISAKSWLTF